MPSTKTFSSFIVNNNEYIRHNGAYFIKIFHQTFNADNLFPADDDNEANNTGSLGEEKYSRLSIISEAFKVHSKYEFILHWPDLGDDCYYHWRQTKNPTIEVEKENVFSAEGFESIYNYTTSPTWGGLVKTISFNGNSPRTFLNGTPGRSGWFYSIALNVRNTDTGIPAYFDGQAYHYAKECDLWLRIPNKFPFFNTKRTNLPFSINFLFTFLSCILR